MKILLSPSKTLNLKNKVEPLSRPIFNDDAQLVMQELKNLNVKQLENLYKVSERLAHQVFDMLHTHHEPLAAIGYFKGEAFRYLDYLTLSPKVQHEGHERLIVLCALYGMLRPFDGVTPYRMDYLVELEQLSLENRYTHFKDTLTDAFISMLQPQELIINLASLEFSKSLNKHALSNHGQWIDVDFVSIKNGKPRTISMIAKRARGSYARLLLQNPPETLADLQAITAFDDFVLDQVSATTLRYLQQIS
ncbi:MAG: YaaA family protein [Erysipelothrix sp.]|jgi:cytoplasmic iron level regulating protein YaaA (DUF328/UPF0246 family)|nr:YaaA family protein [Erysipelothrix sp.]